MLSACFVLPVRDSIDEIFDSIKHTALIQKAGGGTGFAFDELRPTGDFIKSSGGSTSGPISFWRAFSEATNAIQQGAFRRGANMGMMYVDHPDIIKFLHAKQDLDQFTNYNISVKVTDEWMEAFRAAPDSPHVVRNPRTGQRFYLPRDLEVWSYDIRTLVPVEEAGAGSSADSDKYYTRRDIWNHIIQNAWQTGEPGVVFIDRINEENPTPHIGRMEATNPCGEQPLLPYEACNLGSINLAKFVLDAGTPHARVDWDGLRTCIHESTRFLDDVIDANNYPLPQIDEICKGNRKIGLGVMGFADALFKLGVPYNSDAGVNWGERFMQFLNDEAHAYSEQLARTRGSFPNWKGSLWDTRHHRPMRTRAAPRSPRPAPSASSRTALAVSNRCSAWSFSATCSRARPRGASR
jgi:ribonucleoside-diphosphate reductase alpha chain